jgi:hypothetical protein
MAITASGLFVYTWVADMIGSHAINWDLETHKLALVTNVSTPNFSAGSAVAPPKYGDAQFTEIGVTAPYVAGGTVLTGTTVTESPASQLMFDANDWSLANSTITAARGALIYADAIATPVADPAIVLINFGADYATNNGTFTIQWAATGIFTWDVY